MNLANLACMHESFGLDGHLLLYTLSHVEPSGNAPVRPGYNELTLQLATAACHVQVLESYHLRHAYNKHSDKYLWKHA
jgi:hypothetical protein